ncbi:MAG: SgcJ/EcaC family oxidoreductase [Gemmatimonadota bacterium]|nr:SgcJ/EcaC family oxidoreductase [Gemmatimonadota bacterium]
MRRMTTRAVSRVMLMLFVTGCGRSAPAPAPDAAPAVDAIFAKYAASLGAGDADAWSTLWVEEGVQLPPDAPPVVGKAAIREKLRSVLARFHFAMRIRTEEVRTGGDWAFARGTYAATLTPKAGGAPIAIDGKFLTIFLRQPDGSWRIYRDIFNSNAPPP